MQVFTSDQAKSFQSLLETHYSKCSSLTISEDVWSAIYTNVLGVASTRASNLPFNDFVTPTKGVEWKCLHADDPLSKIGKRMMHPSVSRAIQIDPSLSATDAMGEIVTSFNGLIDQFATRCLDIYWGIILYGGSHVLYFEEPFVKLVANDLQAEWVAKASRGAVRRNLWVKDAQGNKIFSYTPNGSKLQLYFDIPEKSKLHIFDLKKTSVPLMVTNDQFNKAKAVFGDIRNAANLANLIDAACRQMNIAAPYPL